MATPGEVGGGGGHRQRGGGRAAACVCEGVGKRHERKKNNGSGCVMGIAGNYL